MYFISRLYHNGFFKKHCLVILKIMSQYLLCLRLPPPSIALSHVTPCRRSSGKSAELLPPLPSLLLPHPTRDHSSPAQGFASRDPDLRHQSTCKLTLSTSPLLLNPNFSTVSCTILGLTSTNSVSSTSSSKSWCLNSPYRGSLFLHWLVPHSFHLPPPTFFPFSLLAF